MSININTNIAAARASFQLSKNNAALQKSLNRLSSGNRIVNPADDAGGLAVALKLKGSISRLAGVEKNISNAKSYLQVQDGILSSASKIVDRMAELKSLSQDVLKNSSDIESYNTEFRNLQVQLHQMSETKFNGVSLFGQGTGIAFGGGPSKDVTVSIFTSSSGESGAKVSINKALLLSALTIDATDPNFRSVSFGTSAADGKHTGTGAIASGASIFSFAAEDSTKAFNLDAVSVAVFSQALENLATLRAENGASTSRLDFSLESAGQRRTNLEAAHGRIMDVDIATESTQLAKYNILVQASASMLAQANQSSSIALMLLG